MLLAALAAALALAGTAAPRALATPMLAITSPESESFTKDTTPAISGTTSYVSTPAALAPVTVRIHEGESSAGPLVQSPAGEPSAEGAWSVTPSTLKEGTYTAVAEQSELLETGTSEPVTFTVKTKAPAVTLESVPSPTEDAQPTLQGELGTAKGDQPSVTVVIYKGSAVGGSVATSGAASVSAPSWTFTPPSPLKDGTYTAQAEQRDEAGNVARSTPRTFEVKASTPVVTMNVYPSPSNDPTPTLTGTASDAEGDDETVEVTIYRGESVGSETAASGSVSRSGTSWSYTAPHLSDGTYTAQATQRDVAGHTGASSPQTFTIDTVAPDVTLEAVPSPSSDATPTLHGQRGTAEGDLAAVEVTIYRGESVGGSEAARGPASLSGAAFSYTTPELADGTYTAQATQRDEAGNLGRSAARTFTIKREKPVVTLNQPEAISNNPTPTFTGSADTRPGDIQTVTLRVYQGSDVAGSAVRTLSVGVNGGSWSAGPVQALPDGTYTAQAEQRDEANNVGLSAEGTFTINTKPPEISFRSVPSQTNDPTPTLKGVRGTAPGDDPQVSVAIYQGSTVGGTPVAASTFSVSGSEWSYTAPHLSDGTYTAQATQEDDAHNVGHAQATFTIDTVAPAVTLAAVPSPSNVSTPALHGVAGTAPGDEGTVSVTIYEGSSTAGRVLATETTSRSGASWSLTASHLADGTYTAQAEQRDEAGNVGHSGAQTFTIDTASPTVTLSSPAPLSNDTTPSFSGTASESAPVTVTLYRGASASGTVVWQERVPVSAGSWSTLHVSPALPDGQYTAIAVEPSSLDNPEGKSAPATFKINTAAPTVTLAQPTSPSKNTTPAFTGTASEGTTVTVKVYEGERPTGSPVAETTATPSGEAWSSPAVHLATGKHTYSAVASQKSSLAGNPEGSSQPATFVVDTTSPTVTLAFERAQALTNSATPTFKGTASDSEGVTVAVYKGKTVSGSPVASATSAAPVNGAWTSGPTSAALAEGTYTAQATQPSSLGNPAGVSAPLTFSVDTKAPAVTMAAINGKTPPAAPKVLAVNTPAPEFSGAAGHEAGDLPKVGIKVTKTGASGPEAPLEETIALSKGATSWSYKSSNLAEGSYTVQVTQSDEAGNVATSAQIAFDVITKPPTVVLDPPAARSNNRRPTFTGTASATTPVTVTIYNEKNVAVSTATAPGTGGAWTSAAATPELPLEKGKRAYSAAATQTDEAGNTTTTARAKFVVDSEAPTITLSQAARTNDRYPAFTGTASDLTPVTVDIYLVGQEPAEGACEKPGPTVATASATGTGGYWASAPAGPAPLADGRYVAIAIQASEVAGNHCGETAPVPFTVDTVAPQPSITRDTGGGESEQLEGTAGAAEGDVAQVTVQLFAGESIGTGQAPIESAPAAVAGGRWSVTLGGLRPGAYTARAVQDDEAGNVGVSPVVVFHIAGAAPAAAAGGRPTAAFSWYPSAPHVGERVSLVSSSSDPTSPLTGYAWDLLGDGPFQPGTGTLSTSFATPGNHVVRLRVTDASGVQSLATETISVAPAALPLIEPFPLVRIVVTRSSAGVRLHLLSIVAGRGAHITITCKGRGCPVKRQSKVASAGKAGLASVSFRSFERLLPAGTTLEIRITMPGDIGKYTRLAVRGGGVLHRSDSCVVPNSTKIMSCPAG